MVERLVPSRSVLGMNEVSVGYKIFRRHEQLVELQHYTNTNYYFHYYIAVVPVDLVAR